MNGYSKRKDKSVSLTSEKISCPEYPNAIWRAWLSGKEDVQLYKSTHLNCVKVMAKLKVNGEEKPSQPEHDYSTTRLLDGIVWSKAIKTNQFKTNRTATDLVLEFAITYRTVGGLSPFSDLRKWNADLLDSGARSGFQIQVKAPGELLTIPVHTCILEPRWPYFKAMLECGLDEAKNNIMVIAEFDLATVKIMLLYLYTRLTYVSDVTTALNVMKIAHRYELTELF